MFQGVTPDNHLAAVKALLSIPTPTKVIISTAFMNKAGFFQLSEKITPVAGVTTLLAGIRNGITSAQGMQASIDSGVTTYAVDTGTRNVIFHPKIYFARNNNEARLILGSANLTLGGLNGNIEASVSMVLDMAVQHDADLVSDIEAKVAAMIAEYPQHVFVVPDAAMVADLLKSGRLVDESIKRPPTPGGSSGDRDLDAIPKMVLKTVFIKPPVVEAPPASAPVPVVAVAPGLPAAVVVVPPAAPPATILEEVWESSPLTRRYLTIPTGANTNATGSMLFTKGTYEIDQRHYFRDVVFNGLPWVADTNPGKTHFERASGFFRLIIRNVDYGVFELRVSHNTSTTSAAYLQSNSMTQLHWGAARSLIARPDLLDRTLTLYKDKAKPDQFVIEID